MAVIITIVVQCQQRMTGVGTLLLLFLGASAAPVTPPLQTRKYTQYTTLLCCDEAFLNPEIFEHHPSKQHIITKID
jgi:hypothetical protein